jgi:DNA-binding HxlR family transcriptional regulator
VAGFRYAQFCPLARAAEIVAERWTLLAVRELLFGPQRFSDLRRALPGVSSSVLADRLARLEKRGLVTRRMLPPPASAAVYELTDLGRALRPVVVELARWGARFLGPPEPGDHLTPRALRIGMNFLASPGPTPARRFALHVSDGGSEERFHLVGGPEGARVEAADGPADVLLAGPPHALAALAAGALAPEDALRAGAIRAEGDTQALADLPLLFGPQPRAKAQERGT